MKPRPPEIVFFDVGHTLVYPHPSVGHVYAAAARRFGIAADEHRVERAFRDAFHAAAAERRVFRQGYDDTAARAFWYRVVLSTFARAGSPLDIYPAHNVQRFFDELHDAFTHAAHWRLYDDARAAVDAVRTRGLRAGIISNWDHRLRPLLDALELTALFDPIVVSIEEGVEKPHPRIFQAALHRAGVMPGAALHVGDSPEDDLAGARSVGMRALWLDRHGKGDPGDPRRIGGLHELAAALDG